MPAVVSCLLTYNNKLLILKRSDKVRTYKGMWGVVAGYIEKGEKPIETAFKEIKEETGLSSEEVQLIREVKPVNITDLHEGEKYDWYIHTFIFIIKKKSKVQIDWEHSCYKWIEPHNIFDYETVPHLKKIVSEALI